MRSKFSLCVQQLDKCQFIMFYGVRLEQYNVFVFVPWQKNMTVVREFITGRQSSALSFRNSLQAIQAIDVKAQQLRDMLDKRHSSQTATSGSASASIGPSAAKQARMRSPSRGRKSVGEDHSKAAGGGRHDMATGDGNGRYGNKVNWSEFN